MPRVALITGAAVRVGRALALGAADAGFDVAVHYHASQAQARYVAREVEALGRRALLVRGDLCASADVRGVVHEVGRAWGRLDLLVNSAATFEAAHPLDVDEAAWDAVMAVNLKAPFLLMRAAAELLREAGGSVVNILDLSALQAWTDHPHHAVSKAGLLHLTRVMARALAPRVRVNAVAPGTVLPPESFGAQELARELARTPLGRIGSPEDVVRTVLFLADSPFITGEVIIVDGGRHLAF